MTTAARPTFDPARGGTGRGEKDLSAISKQYSSRDLPGHTKLKYRDQGQGTTEELRQRDFRKDLEDREIKSSSGSSKSSSQTSSIPTNVRRAIEANATVNSTNNSANATAAAAAAAGGAAGGGGGSSNAKKLKLDQMPAANLDQDDPADADSSSDDDSDDDTAQLLEELNKIKRERVQENTKKDQEKKQEDERIRMENILSGNPLLNYSAGVKADLKVKRRWDDDVVFKNCARTEPEKASLFINDSLRSEFHKKFMEKYIK